jgi:hypothetical protein
MISRGKQDKRDEHEMNEQARKNGKKEKQGD